MRRRLARLGGVAALCISSLAKAQAPSRVRLVWRVSPEATGCAEHHVVRGQLRERLERDPFDDEALEMLRVVIERSSGRTIAHLSSVEADGTQSEVRQLASDSSDCAELTDALVLALALRLAEEATPPVDEKLAPPLSMSPPLQSAPPVAPALEMPPSVPSLQDPVPRSAWLALGALGAVGRLPEATLGASIAAAIGVGRRFALMADVSYLAPRHAVREDAKFALSATEAFVGARYGCAISRSAWNLGVEGGLVGGFIHAIPEQPQPLDTGDSGFGGARAGVSLMLPLYERLGVRLAIGPQVVFTAWHFRVQGREEPVWVQPWLSAWTAASIFLGEP